MGLKGVGDVTGGTKKKKKKKKKKRRKEKAANAVVGEIVDGERAEEVYDGESTLGYVIRDEDGPPADRRTKAERRYEQTVAQRELEAVKKAAGTTHRERVKDFNEKLASMSEHHDIPKVGPG